MFIRALCLSSRSLHQAFIKNTATHQQQAGDHLKILGRRFLRSLQGGAASGRQALIRPTSSQSLLPGALAGSSGLPASFSSSNLFTGGVTAAGALAAFSEMGLFGWLLVDVAFNLGGWAVGTLFKTEKYYDLVGSFSFLTLTAGSLFIAGAGAPRKILVSCMVGVWALRLGSYLVARVHKVGKDSRFDEVKNQPGTFLVYWMMQAVWVWVTLTPVLIINTAAAATPLRWMDGFGVALWVVGLGFEAVADAQKDAWRGRPENKGRFITEGLWSISRHPNYFGEMLLWCGVFLTCVGGFTKGVHYASIASPISVMLLLRFVSGVPILERQADARWGGQADYEHYKATTPILVPKLLK